MYAENTTAFGCPEELVLVPMWYSSLRASMHNLPPQATKTKQQRKRMLAMNLFFPHSISFYSTLFN